MGFEASSPDGIFEACPTSVVSDALDDVGIDGVITGLSPVRAGASLVGRASPMQFERATGGGTTNFPYAMLEELEEGRVFVIDSPRQDVSCWGGLAAALAGASGLHGVVINGGYRDVPALCESELPVFGAGPTPKTGQRRLRVASVDEGVEIQGISVSPDDVIVADATGIVVVPGDRDAEVAEAAAEILREDRDVEAAIADGATVSELHEADREF